MHINTLRMAQLGHLHWPGPVCFQELGGIPLTGMKDEPRGKGAAQGEQDGAAGSRCGICWALRGAEMTVGGCFSLVFLITVMAYDCCHALSSSCVWDCWWEERAASLSSGAIQELQFHLFLHLISRCEPQQQAELSQMAEPSWTSLPGAGQCRSQAHPAQPRAAQAVPAPAAGTDFAAWHHPRALLGSSISAATSPELLSQQRPQHCCPDLC